MRVHVLGVVSLNGGDAAILGAEVAILRDRWPDAHLVVSDSHPEAARRYLPELEFVPFLNGELLGSRGRPLTGRRLGLARRRLLAAASLCGRRRTRPLTRLLTSRRERAVFDRLRRADVAAYTGGTSLTDNYALGGKVFDLDVARRLRVPLVFFQQSAGPFRKPENREGLQGPFAAADLVLLRDQRSLGHVLEVGARPERCRVLPDTVFALVRDPLPPVHGAAGGRVRVAVSLRSWSYFDGLTKEEGMARYLASVRAAVTRVVRERDAEVVFVSTCQGRPEYWTDDSRVATEAVQGLPDDVRDRCRVDAAAYQPEALVDLLTGFDVMLSTRLHGAITAACAGVPTLAVAYEYKTHEVWGQLGLSEWSFDISTLDPDTLAQALLDLVDQRAEVRDVLELALPHQREGARSAADLIDDVVAGRPLRAGWTL